MNKYILSKGAVSSHLPLLSELSQMKSTCEGDKFQPDFATGQVGHIDLQNCYLVWKWLMCEWYFSIFSFFRDGTYTVTHTRNSCSAFNPSKVHTHTHTMNTYPEQWAAIYAAAHGEQLGARCLAQGHLSRGIEGGESAGHSLPPPTIPAGPRLELATFGLRVQLSKH